jgi:hypothetical protein
METELAGEAETQPLLSWRDAAHQQSIEIASKTTFPPNGALGEA